MRVQTPSRSFRSMGKTVFCKCRLGIRREIRVRCRCLVDQRWVLVDQIGLIMVYKQDGEKALGQTGALHQITQEQSRSGTVLHVFEKSPIAGLQVGNGVAYDLVTREIPRLNAPDKTRQRMRDSTGARGISRSSSFGASGPPSAVNRQI